MADKRRMDWDPSLSGRVGQCIWLNAEAATESYRLAGKGDDANLEGSPDANRIARQVAQ